MRRSRTRIGGATQTTQAIGFEQIANARVVYAIMRKVQIAQAETDGGDNA
jgi:hypothetical protein